MTDRRTMRIDDETWARWKQYAQERGVSVTQLVIEATDARVVGQVEVKHSRDQLLDVVRGRDLRTFRGPDWRK